MSDAVVSDPVEVPGVDRSTLTPVVRRALGRGTAEVIAWGCQPLYGGAVSAVSGGGVYLFQGMCVDRGETLPWSVVLKISPPFGDGATHEEPSSPVYWKRELLVYKSDLLATLPDGLAAPRCHGTRVLEGKTTWLWLEYVEDVHRSSWPLERYGLAARHLGRFNGQYLTERPIPNLPWLARKGLRQEQERRRRNAFMTTIREELDQGGLAPELTPSLVEDSLAFLERQDTYLGMLDRLPQTLGHRETFKRNLLARRDAFGCDQTVLLDWTHVGLGPLGEDLSSLVFYTLLFRDVESSDFGVLAEASYEGYLEGLRDVGWRGDPQLVQLGYTLTAALRFSLFLSTMIFPRHMPEEQRRMLESIIRRPLADIRVGSLEVYRQAYECAREAERLAADLWRPDAIAA